MLTAEIIMTYGCHHRRLAGGGATVLVLGITGDGNTGVIGAFVSLGLSELVNRPERFNKLLVNPVGGGAIAGAGVNGSGWPITIALVDGEIAAVLGWIAVPTPC
jgi:hypothetical protein